MKNKIRIGCGAGFSGDRLEPALVLAEAGELDYLVLECLAERTIALAQKRLLEDPAAGYDPLLERRITSLLPLLVKNGICLITNMGAANPIAAAQKIVDIARQQNLPVKVAAVTGDDVLADKGGQGSNKQPFHFDDFLPFAEDEKIISAPANPILSEQVISANAYLGVEGILDALKAGAQVIVTGRVADPSLFLAPMMFEFGWATGNHNLLGQGTVVGHLLECAGQVTGGYFADPLKKPVENLTGLGHPFADVYRDGTAVISKVEGTGGVVNLQTAKEQLLYEVINPHAYITPDVVADFTTVWLKETGKDQVQVGGGSGSEKLPTYKVSVGYKAFYLGEAGISYAGRGALERATLAGAILKERLTGEVDELRIDQVGINSTHRTNLSGSSTAPYEVRLHVAGRSKSAAGAARVGEEVEALYTNGPAAGGGVRKYVTEVIGIVSVLTGRDKLSPKITLFNA